MRRPARPRADDQDGASLVEFALIAPVLLLLVFGIIDFGWVFAQHQDVRHGTREGARLAAVNYDPPSSNSCHISNLDSDQLDELICVVQARTGSLNDGDTTVLVDLLGDEIGDSVKVRICYPTDSVTGFFDFLNINLTSTAEMRLEQEPDFSDNWDSAALPNSCTPAP